jgi:Do/DeqQ family serine protease
LAEGLSHAIFIVRRQIVPFRFRAGGSIFLRMNSSIRFACIAVAALAATPVLSQTAPQSRITVPQSRGEIALSFSPVVKKAAPAVVNVYAQRVVKQARNPLFDDPFFRQFFGNQLPGGGRDRVQKALGSGVIVDPTGVIVTNYHVIENADQVKVALGDKREFEAEILLRDKRSDLAVLKIKDAHEKFPAIEFGDSDKIEVGDLVLAIGDPFGVGQTVTQGIVSALARTNVGISDYSFFIQTDAAINPGNSGGALVDLAGRLVGINTAIYSQSGGSVGIGFAIPVSMVRVVLASAQGGGKVVKRPWFGAKLQNVTPEIAESMNLKRPTGALVADVTAGSPAAHAGIKTGDVIVSVDGQSIDDQASFGYRFGTKPLGGTARISVERAGKPLSLQVKLASAPENAREEITIAANSPFAGVKVQNLSPAVADELHLDADAKGVVIVGVADGSPAQSIGFRAGDIVESVNDKRIEKTRDLERVSMEKARSWRIVLRRGGRQISVVLNG